ncbi:MAG: ferritin-like domain-containing protein [Deltaproteobacteria bacterium]|nr:ferritin-like domain-containing protein [Deltaproteobacteria bacterium]MBI3391367.1 ferritin-like domain-containing protein [Deltaproteobacteria bacterium]
MATAAAATIQGIDNFDAELETILTSFDTNYAWNYGSVKAGLRDLYEKAKREQWNGTQQLAWDTPVDPEGEIIPQSFNPLEDYAPYKKLSAKQVGHFRHAQIGWQLSQFMHGEQGALIVASQLTGAVPWMDAKYYAATQTMDEARHVEVFSRYLREKLEWEWPINPNLKKLLDLIICDRRWDFKYLGMQILVEGLAMAAFANMYQLAQEPLAKELVHYVMKDESRHVAFGVISLKDYYVDMPEVELRDREDFVIEACQLMRDRLLADEVAQYMGFPLSEVRQIVLNSPVMKMFRQALFARVVPNIKRLGLLTPRVRAAFEALEIIQFEEFDPEAQDRAIGL